jgi:hypothetical protein
MAVAIPTFPGPGPHDTQSYEYALIRPSYVPASCLLLDSYARLGKVTFAALVSFDIALDASTASLTCSAARLAPP